MGPSGSPGHLLDVLARAHHQQGGQGGRVVVRPGSDLDLDAGRTAIAHDEPTRPDGLCRPGGRPGTPWPGQEMRTTHTLQEPGLAGLAGWLTDCLAGWRAARMGATDTRRKEAPGVGRLFFPLAPGGVEIGRTRQREVWPLTSMASNYSPSRGHPESPPHEMKRPRLGGLSHSVPCSSSSSSTLWD